MSLIDYAKRHSVAKQHTGKKQVLGWPPSLQKTAQPMHKGPARGKPIFPLTADPLELPSAML